LTSICGQKFFKLQATGNDFIVLDNRHSNIPHQDATQWCQLCTHHLGIGADGVLLLERSDQFDFHMRYLNSDGHPATMCGNGARAITLFAHQVLKLKATPSYHFTTDSGEYHATITRPGMVEIKMANFSDRNKYQIDDLSSYHPKLTEQFYINSGVEHLVLKVDDVDSINLELLAPPLRSHANLPQGANINLVEKLGTNQLKMRTFEKGVEGETLSCGTGAVAAALAADQFFQMSNTPITIFTKGGEVRLQPADDQASAMFSGEVKVVFEGIIY
jgi:diaminopimelate epimerase